MKAWFRELLEHRGSTHAGSAVPPVSDPYVDPADPGWVFHEPDADGSGFEGWLYHYADGAMAAEDGTVYEYASPDTDTDTDDASDPGWVFHEPDADESGFEGWLYHYADGAMAAEDGTVYEYPPPDTDTDDAPEPLSDTHQPNAHASDPGWVFHEPDADESGFAGWLYHYADGAIAAEDGTLYQQAPSDAITAVAAEAEPELKPDARLEAEPEPGPDHERESEPDPEPEPERWSEAEHDRERESEPDPAPEQDPDPDRKLERVLVVLALIFTSALVLMLAQWWGGGERDRSAPEAGQSGQATGQHAVWFDPPETVRVNTQYVRSRILASGDLEVDHWIRSSRPTFELTLTVPRSIRDDVPSPRAREVTVASEGETQDDPRAVRTNRTYSFAATRTLHVRYVLSGVLVRGGTVPDRALALATFLDLTFTNDRVSKTVQVTGGRLLAAACSAQDPNAAPRPCGNADGSGWRVELDPSARHHRVTAQLDLRPESL